MNVVECGSRQTLRLYLPKGRYGRDYSEVARDKCTIFADRQVKAASLDMKKRRELSAETNAYRKDMA